MKRLISFILVICMISVLFAACNGKTIDSDTKTDTKDTEETAPAAEEIHAPDRGTPDRSGLKYLDSIEGYLKNDWSAEWIWTKGCSEDSYVAFRKTFTVDKAEKATAYVSAVDKYVLWLNGEMKVIDGSLKRGPTPYDSYYDTVELDLREGENTIAVLVAFNGRSGDGSIVPVMTDEEGDEIVQAGFLFEMNAGGAVVKSDNTWKVIRHNGYKNRVTGGKEYVRYDQSSMLAERNVWYNANDGIGDFTGKDFDDSGWDFATPIAKPGDIPFGYLYDSIIGTPKFGEVIDFQNSENFTGTEFAEDSTITLELPGNIQFTWYIELESESGKKITAYTDTYTDRQNMANFKDTYVTCDGKQSYENYPWRSGSKLILEVEKGIKIDRIGYRTSGFNGEWAGDFTTPDSSLDQLWHESLNTIAICMRDTYMDCPERERGPYMGDASNQIDAALYSYDEGGLELTKKAILACIAWTPEGGAIPSRAPSVKPQEIPNQSLIFMSSAYHYYMHSGDTETMTAYYKAFVEYLKLFEMENGLPVYREGSWMWNDWGEKIDTVLLQAAIYYYALSLTDRLADELGTEKDAVISERIEEIKENWREKYYTPDGFKSEDAKSIDERANAMLALSGLAGEEDYELITKVIMNTYEASPFTEKYVLEALCIMGHVDLALERMLKRYAPMLDDEWDTLWELFVDDTGTYNHGWSAAPLYILSKYVAGVRPVKAGWEEFEIVPSDAVEEFSAAVWTPKGIITVDKTPDKIIVNAPDGGTLVLGNGERIALGSGTTEYPLG